MTGKLKYLLILLLGINLNFVSAQNCQVLYYMNLPQSHLLNPALKPSNSLYIGLPGISGININVNNNFVNFSDIFMKGQTNDSVITFLHPDNNIDDFLAKIKDKNSIEPEVSVQLFGLGFAVGKSSYVFLDINDRVEGNVALPRDLFTLAFKGNEGFVGSKIDLTSLRGDIKYFRETGLGFSKDFTSKLRIGVKGKLLFGLASASINNKSLGITVNNDYTHTLDADLSANFSDLFKVYINKNQNIDSIVIDDNRFDSGKKTAGFLTSTKNIGLGLDIGATYNISEKLTFSASITDLGFIKWKEGSTSLEIKNHFEFSGLDLDDVINGTKTIDSVGKEVLNSLKDGFKVSDLKTGFTTFLSPGVSLGGCYSLTRSFSLGLLSYSRFIGKQVHESLTLSGNLNLGNVFSTSLSYTAANNRYDNFGAGLAFRPGIFQFYLIADRIPVTWNKIKIDKSTIPVPSNWNTINLRLGMNIALGNRIKKKNDKPMVLVE